MGRPPTTRLKVKDVMLNAHTPLSVTDICRLLSLDPKVHNNSIGRALKALGAKVVSIHRPRPRPNTRGACKPVNLWSL